MYYFNASPITGVAYAWSVPSGRSVISGQGTHEVTISAGSVSGFITVTPFNSVGQGSSQVIAVTLQPCIMNAASSGDAK